MFEPCNPVFFVQLARPFTVAFWLGDIACYLL
jgi:hypothetical protein